IPWVFGWSQNRHLITGWYGVGTAISRFVEIRGSAGRELLQQMFRSLPLFRLVIDEVEKTLPLVDLAIARRFAALAADPDVRAGTTGMIESEYHRTVRCLLEITGEGALLERFPNYRSRLESRLPMLNRASRLQAELLGRVRSRKTSSETDEDFVPLLLSINCV